MPIGITEDHLELAGSLTRWAAALDPIARVRAAEERQVEDFVDVWAGVAGMGIPSIAVPAGKGGGDGSLLDLAVALEACAYALVPGSLLTTAVAQTALGTGTEHPVGLQLPGSDVVWGSGDLVLTGVDGGWFLVQDKATGPAAVVDLAARAGTRSAVADGDQVEGLTDEKVRLLAVTLAAAEASGVARWCLDTAVSYAKVREQFGAPIGSFQAIKHLCAEMLEISESVTAAAWDAARAYDEAPGEVTEQWRMAALVAGSVCFDGAVWVAKSSIQVLGGIGFTFEHDAHLYLRRTLALRAMLGSGSSYDVQIADHLSRGVRRRGRIDFEGRDEQVRERARRDAERIAGLPSEQRRAALVETKLLAPHWPEPFGLGADPVHQLVIDEELIDAGVQRPDIAIGGWAAPTILAHGSADQRDRFVPGTLSGEIVWCQLFSEPGAGSDLASLRTRAVRVEGGWRLTGQKVWTSLAQRADWGICLARTDPDAKPHHGISYFLVDMSSTGIEIRPLRELTGEAMFNEVFLDDVFVPDECLVGELNGGWKLARTTLANERVAMAGSQLGTSVEAALAVLGDSELDRARVGHAAALSSVVSLLNARATLRSIAGHGPGAESSVAKLVGVRSRQDSAELVVELLGDRVMLGDATARDALHQLLVTRCLSIAGGTTQVLRNVAGERILGLPR